jgi:hypothetical protein
MGKDELLNQLREFLPESVCSQCRYCCVFFPDDVWEAPMIEDGAEEAICGRFAVAGLPAPVFDCRRAETAAAGSGGTESEGASYSVFKASFSFDPSVGRDAWNCPARDPEKGCILGPDKPFDCVVWPFRPMRLSADDGMIALTLSPGCEAIMAAPLGKMAALANGAFGDAIIDYARKNYPKLHVYREGYPILRLEHR